MELDEISEEASKKIKKLRGGCSNVKAKVLDDGTKMVEFVATNEDGASLIGRDIIVVNGDDYTMFSTYPISYERKGDCCRLTVCKGKIGQEGKKTERLIMISAGIENEVEAMIKALEDKSPELATELINCTSGATLKDSEKIIEDIKNKRSGKPIVREKTLNDGTIMLDCLSTSINGASRIGRDIVFINGNEYTKFSTYPVEYARTGEACHMEVEKGKIDEIGKEAPTTEKFVMTKANGDAEIQSMVECLKERPELVGQLKKVQSNTGPMNLNMASKSFQVR